MGSLCNVILIVAAENDDNPNENILAEVCNALEFSSEEAVENGSDTYSNEIFHEPDEEQCKENPEEEMHRYPDQRSGMNEPDEEQCKENPEEEMHRYPEQRSRMEIKKMYKVDSPRYKCRICGFILHSRELMGDHLKLHDFEEEIIKCTICTRSMKRREMQKHRDTVHKGKYQGFIKCSECDKEYARIATLRKHYSTNHEEFGIIETCLMVCDVCGQKCRGNNAFEAHKRTHTGEKPFVCPICPKAFRIKKSLECHMRVHTGEKPMVCQFCGKKFAHHFPYRYHLKTHTGEKSFFCEACGKGFISRSNMKQHWRVCAGPKEEVLQ